MPDDVQSTEQLDKEISMLEIVSFILRRRRLILISALSGVFLGFLLVVSGSPKYTATVSFTPQGGGNQASAAGLAGLAQSFGVSVPRSGDATRSLQFYQDLITSREILDQLIESDIEVGDRNIREPVRLYEHFDISGETIEELTDRTRQYLLDEDVISTNSSQFTGIVTISARTSDAELSNGITRRLVNLVSEFDLETRQSQALAERLFAEERLAQLHQELLTTEGSLKEFLDENRQFSNSPQLNFEHDRLQRQVLMRQELVTALAQAHEQARIDEVRNTPVITVINQPDSPTVPDPRGWLPILLVGFIFGVIVGLGIALAQEYGDRAKSEDGRAYREFRKLLTDARKNPFRHSPSQ